MAIVICRTDERNDVGIHHVSNKELNWLAKSLNLKIQEVANARFINLEIGKVKLSFFNQEGDK